MPVAPNLLAQNFSASAPNEKWAGDITYIINLRSDQLSSFKYLDQWPSLTTKQPIGNTITRL
ncbi:mobile element protein [Vibrio sp. JCM 18905]|nr:mobile element protein [Vibrio sp. JCM 18905]